MAYVQWPYMEIMKKDKTLKLTNFPRNHNVSVLFPQ